jgi:uncharacterized BrkB/YihY/UPF0761 family membrane protein
MQNAMYEVWGIKKEQRPGFPLSQLWSLALVLTVGIGFIVTTFLSGVAAGAGHLISGEGAHVAAVAISLILNLGVFWLSFKIATAWRVPWRDLRTGSVIAAVCWQILQTVGGYVVGHQLHRASELYGTFGVVLGLLTWLFLQAEVTLLAAEVDVVLARRLWPRSVLPAPAEEPAAEPEPAQETRPAPEGRGDQDRQNDRASLEEQPGRDDRADAVGPPSVPPPRGEPSASDKKAGSAR